MSVVVFHLNLTKFLSKKKSFNFFETPENNKRTDLFFSGFT